MWPGMVQPFKMLGPALSSCKAAVSCVSWLSPGGRSLDHSAQIHVRKDFTCSSSWSQERLSAFQPTSNTMQSNLTTLKKC